MYVLRCFDACGIELFPPHPPFYESKVIQMAGIKIFRCENIAPITNFKHECMGGGRGRSKPGGGGGGLIR